MSVWLPLDKYLYLVINTKTLWGKQRTKQLCCLYRPKHLLRISHTIPLRVLHTSKPRCKWTRDKKLWNNKYIYCHDFLCYRFSKLCTSKELAKTNSRMSRFKNAIESVSKAVSGTQSELASRISWLKSHSRILNKSVDSNGQKNSFHVNLEGGKQTATTREGYSNSLGVKQPVSACGDLDPGGANHGSLTDLADIKTNLFHVSYFATSFGETYNFLASHINCYFSTSVMNQEKKGNASPPKPPSQVGETLDPQEDILGNENRIKAASALISAAQSPEAEKMNTSPPASSKKSITSFLSYPSNSVQAFVDSYIGGLVPKLRSDTKSALQEKSKVQEGEEIPKDEEETKSADEKEKRLSLQREKVRLYKGFIYFLKLFQ